MMTAAVPPPGLDTDAPPQLPPEATRRPSLRQLAGAQEEMGEEAASPQARGLGALKGTTQNLEILAQSFPDLAPALAQLTEQLEQAVTQAMAQAVQGGGGMPMAPPPPPGGMPMQ